MDISSIVLSKASKIPIEAYGLERLVQDITQLRKEGHGHHYIVGSLRLALIEALYVTDFQMAEDLKDQPRKLAAYIWRVYVQVERATPLGKKRQFWRKPPTTKRVRNRRLKSLSPRIDKAVGLYNNIHLQLNDKLAGFLISNDALEEPEVAAIKDCDVKPYTLKHIPEPRGRIMATSHISYQGAKPVRACIEFAERYKVENPEPFLSDINLSYGITEANCKDTWDNRDAFILEPMKLKAAFDLIDFLDTGYSNRMHYRDATGSAIQIIGTLMRDEKMMRASNVIPSPTKQDPYSDIADIKDPLYHKWIKHLTIQEIRKHLIKAVILPHGYGAGPITAAEELLGYTGVRDLIDFWTIYLKRPHKVSFDYPRKLIPNVKDPEKLMSIMDNLLTTETQAIIEWYEDCYPAHQLFIDSLRAAGKQFVDKYTRSPSLNIAGATIQSYGMKVSKFIKDKEISVTVGARRHKISLLTILSNDGVNSLLANSIHRLDNEIAVETSLTTKAPTLQIYDAMISRINEIELVTTNYNHAFTRVMTLITFNDFMRQLDAEPVSLPDLGPLKDVTHNAQLLWGD